MKKTDTWTDIPYGQNWFLAFLRFSVTIFIAKTMDNARILHPQTIDIVDQEPLVLFSYYVQHPEGNESH